MKRPLSLVVVVAALLAAVGALYLWSVNRGGARESLSANFPADTEVYLEVTRLGQWMDLPTGSESAAAPGPRGSDPLLQVLGQVWAAEPVKPQDLPALLKDQPLAFGLWHGKERWEGTVLLSLAPGQRSQVEAFLSEKVGGSPAGTQGGISLRRAEFPGHDVPSLLWGVDDARAVMATSPEAVARILAPAGPSLASSSAFRKATSALPGGPGALLFVDGRFARDLGVPEIRRQFMALFGEENCKPDEPAPAPPAAGAPGAEPGAKVTPPSPDGKWAWAWPALKEFASTESLAGMALWTAPTATGEESWDLAASLAYAESTQGVWKLLAGVGSVRPTLDDRVPRDGDSYLWLGGFDLAREYRSGMEEASKRLPADQVGNLRGAVGFLEGKLDLSLANDLLPTMGDEALFVYSRGKDSTRWAVVVSLKDARRFESLVSEKAAKTLSLEAVSFPGARGWKSSHAEGLTLLVSGGLAVVTADPAWALTTGGEEGRAWKRLSSAAGSASGLLSLTPEAGARVPAFASWTLGVDGVSLRAQVPGTLPKLPHPGKAPAPAAAQPNA